MTEPVPVVVCADEMDDETFMRHFEHRHAEQLPGLRGFVHTIDSTTLEAYRTFHDQIHTSHTHHMMESPHAHE